MLQINENIAVPQILLCVAHFKYVNDFTCVPLETFRLAFHFGTLWLNAPSLKHDFQMSVMVLIVKEVHRIIV